MIKLIEADLLVEELRRHMRTSRSTMEIESKLIPIIQNFPVSHHDKRKTVAAAKREADYWANSLYSSGYAEGINAILKEMTDRDETTTLTEATQEQIERWDYCRVTHFCDKCNKGFGDGLSGLYSFCPMCGRRIIRPFEKCDEILEE